MIEFNGQIKQIGVDYETGKRFVTLESDSLNLASIEKYKNKPLTVEVKNYRKKRSLDANAYFWVLLDKLAYEMKKSKIELYRGYIKHIGGSSDTVCCIEKAVPHLVKGWEAKGIGWQTEITDSKIDGCKNVTLYYGSSEYDTKQMSTLIDLVVQDCESAGIQTLTPRELAMLKNGWSNE